MNDRELIYKDDARAAILRAEPRAAYCIDRVKAVDAVEVVRCKDCKHRYTMSNGHSFCRENFPLGKYDDDFCSYGERRCEDGK